MKQGLVSAHKVLMILIMSLYSLVMPIVKAKITQPGLRGLPEREIHLREKEKVACIFNEKFVSCKCPYYIRTNSNISHCTSLTKKENDWNQP
jgi:hypothetical protein